MIRREIENHEQTYSRLDIFDSPPPPPPEPIYALTTSDKTELVKVQGHLRVGKLLERLHVFSSSLF
jgi:hypothetical protein